MEVQSSFVFMCFVRTLFFRVSGGPPDLAFLLLFQDNPAPRTSVISTPNTVFFPKTASGFKISGNPASRVAVKSRISSRNFAFSRISLYLGQIPDPEISFQTLINILVPYKALLLGIVK